MAEQSSRWPDQGKPAAGSYWSLLNDKSTPAAVLDRIGGYSGSVRPGGVLRRMP